MIFEFGTRLKKISLPFLDNGSFWIISFKKFTFNEINDLRKYLNDDCQLRASKYKSKKDHDNFVVRWAALIYCLEKHLDLPVNSINIKRTNNGKPFLTDHPEVEFNMSYTKDYAFIGIFKNEAIGVDIEIIDRENDCSSSMDSFLTPSEQNLFTSKEDSQITPLVAWTAKEAYLKAIGTGFRINDLPIIVDVYKKKDNICCVHLGLEKVLVYYSILFDHLLAVCHIHPRNS